MLRADQQIIASLIEPNSKVIDIGCGKGELLQILEQDKNVRGHGIELEYDRVAEAVGQGLSVIQGDADIDLVHYPDNGFDYTVLALTLQVMKDPKAALQHCLRIGKQAIVVIPNFGHIANRWYLIKNGKMPISRQLSYQWYETPNIHFCTIKDFLELCYEVDCSIEQRIALYNNKSHKCFDGCRPFGANLFAKQGIFILKSKS